ncbi:hypothetical protein FIBSPDRAFT_933205 [Athelia psychrophila]|uniref:Uncharacterized protein n=1 Tax=Athelia psychrophila TaxID=1759441 RepID=A0A166HEZ7_9AGAM|nr:hypothetical protein FIBSPDRAFT_933205 [Fibularhizoctonia sp. CBS 109695]
MSICKGIRVSPCQAGFIEEKRVIHPGIDGTKDGARAGDVLVASVYISQPIFTFIKKHKKSSRMDAGIILDGQISQYSKATFESHQSKGGMKDRPVILVTGSPGVRKICVMSTFGGKDKATLPRLLQLFLVPVYTTEIPGTTPHIHTTPTWRGKGKPQWVIAYPFDAGKLHLNRRWNDNNGTGPTNYTVDGDFLVYLDNFGIQAANTFKRLLPYEQTELYEEFKMTLAPSPRRELAKYANWPCHRRSRSLFHHRRQAGDEVTGALLQLPTASSPIPYSR